MTHSVFPILFNTVTFVCFYLLTDSNPGTRPVCSGLLNDVRPEAPNVHPAVWSPTIPHGPERVPRCTNARARVPSYVWTDGSAARLPNDEDAGTAWTQAHWGRPQPTQHFTAAAPAPATVTAGLILLVLRHHICF